MAESDKLVAAGYYDILRTKTRGGKNTHMRKARRVILKIYRILTKDKREPFKSAVGITASEMFVGGSVGQGTAVPGHYDLDLVIYSIGKEDLVQCMLLLKREGLIRCLLSDIDSEDVIMDIPDQENPGKTRKKGYHEIQGKLEVFLKKRLSPKYTHIKTTNVAISFKYDKLEVDLLLSPLWDTRGDYYKAMRKIPDPRVQFRWFSVSTSRYQTEFIRKHEGWEPENIQKYRGKLHELIRRAKIWRNEAWKDDTNGRPKSYLLSLLVIYAYNEVGKTVPVTRKLKGVVELVAKEMKAVVEKIATDHTGNLNLVIPETRPEVLSSDLVCDPPRIVDPANPINNLYLSGVGSSEGRNKWEPFREKVKNFSISEASCHQLYK